MLVIIPYEAVGTIHFGMSATEAIQSLGQPKHRAKNRRDEVLYRYADFSVTFSGGDGRVVEVGMTPQADVHLDGVDIFKSPDSFEILVRKDGAPFESLGFIILLNLGITLTGFHDDDPAQKAVTAFKRGRWDHLRDGFKEYVHTPKHF
jgi:hypothetical protein